MKRLKTERMKKKIRVRIHPMHFKASLNFAWSHTFYSVAFFCPINTFFFIVLFLSLTRFSNVSNSYKFKT